MKKEETFKCLKDTPTGSYKAGKITDNPLCAYLPEYFASYKFTTNNGDPMYFGDLFYYVLYGEIRKTTVANLIYNDPNDRAFSTPEAAQAYLDEQNKLKFEKGKVYTISDKPEFIAMFSGERFGYGFVYDGNWAERIGIVPNYDYREATPAEWEAALIKEAERRGFKDGAKFYGVEGAEKDTLIEIGKPNEVSFLNHRGGGLHCSDSWIFFQGKWASIISEPEKEKTTAEWIRHYKDSDMGLCEFVKKFNLIITKAPSNA